MPHKLHERGEDFKATNEHHKKPLKREGQPKPEGNVKAKVAHEREPKKGNAKNEIVKTNKGKK